MQTMLIPALTAILGCVSVWISVNGLASMIGSKNKVAKIKGRIGSSGVTAKSSGFTPMLAGFAGQLGEHVAPKDESELSNTSFALLRAGFYGKNAAKIFWGAKIALASAGLFLALAIRFLTGFEAAMGVVLLVVIVPGVIGMYLPNYWLKNRIAKRRHAIQCSLPDALDLMVVCVEAGMGLDQAIHRVSEEMSVSDPILSQEFKLVILELRAGKARQDALKNLARRVNLEDVNSLVTLIVQSDSFGTSIAKTLRVYSDAMRTTRYQRAEEIASKLPVKILFPLILFILPALFMVLAGPASIKLMGVFKQMP
jgi:tight adherence protein C